VDSFTLPLRQKRSSLFIVMTTILAVAADGLPIFDAAGQPLFQIPGGGVASAIGTMANINPTNGVPRDATGADINHHY
jgi:hypothetical protein